MAISNSEREMIKEALAIVERETAADGSSIILKGFGTFKRKLHAARTARNPATGAAIQVPAKSKLAFSASPAQTR